MDPDDQNDARDAGDIGPVAGPVDRRPEELPADHRVFTEVFTRLDDLVSLLNNWAKGNGVAFVKEKPSNYVDGQPTRYEIVCDRGGKVRHSLTP